MDFIRIWNEIDLDELQKKILIAEDQYGHCPGCKKIGIKIDNLKSCPSCGRQFAYVTSKDAQGNKTDVVMRIMRKLPDLKFVDYSDYIKAISKKNTMELFKK